jgi:alpha-L-fucosidase 2
MRRALAAGLIAFASLAFGQRSLTLWYRQPAKLWVEALPVGNGRLGAMVFGGTAHERIQFNEQTVWTGEPHDYSHPGAYRYLAQIRELLWQGKQKEAEDLAMREFMSVPVRQRAYQSFGDLLLDFPDVREAEVTDYRRELNLDTAIASVQYKSAGVTYRREVFASYPAKVIVVRLSADKPGSISFSAGLDSTHPHEIGSPTPNPNPPFPSCAAAGTTRPFASKRGSMCGPTAGRAKSATAKS